MLLVLSVELKGFFHLRAAAALCCNPQVRRGVALCRQGWLQSHRADIGMVVNTKRKLPAFRAAVHTAAEQDL